MLGSQRLERYRNELNLALYCCYLKMTRKKRKRNINRHIVRRDMEGAYNIFVERYLMDSESQFREYFRLSPSEFDYVLSEVNEDLQPQLSNYITKPISSREKLSITLRYLITWFLFRVFVNKNANNSLGRLTQTIPMAVFEDREIHLLLLSTCVIWRILFFNWFLDTWRQVNLSNH